MLTKSEIQLIRSLHNKEGRIQSGLFAAEGHKIVSEMLSSGFVPELIIATEQWAASNLNFKNNIKEKLKIASGSEIDRCSSFKTPQDVIAVCWIPEKKKITDADSKLIIALDNVQDPGNTGTILRIAAWFGVDYVICSETCADLYNPKVIQASMGAFYRVNAIYGDLKKLLLSVKKKGYKIASACLGGDSVDSFQPYDKLVVVMGNESRGVTSEIREISDNLISIPAFSENGSGIESLNVSTATAILCYEMTKKQFNANKR